MSRIRSIHPGFFTDERLVATSMAARLLFIGLGVIADDKGIFEWKPLTIKMKVFPGDNIEVAGLLEELKDADAIRAYEIDGRQYGAIRNFRKFQRPKTPNDLYPAPNEIRIYVGLDPIISETNPADEVQFPKNGETFPQKGEKSFQMEDGGWRMEDGDILSSLRSDISPSPPCEGFDDFWKAYPRKIGKGQARKAWKAAAKKAPPGEIVAALAVQAKRWQQEGRSPEYIPHPTTWLNGERWADEIEQVDDWRKVFENAD
jgi:hypothetical protein